MSAAARMVLFVLLVPIAGWAQPIDVSNDAITCNTVIGTASFAPSLVNGGTGTTTMRVKGSVTGCTVTGPHFASIRSGRLTGKLTGPKDCLTLAAPLTGSLTIQWKADRRTPILPRSSRLKVTNVSFSLFSAPWGPSYGQFSLGTGDVTGAFTGGDNGATSSNASLTSQDIGTILAECGSPTGLRKLNTGVGQINLR